TNLFCLLVVGLQLKITRCYSFCYSKEFYKFLRNYIFPLASCFPIQLLLILLYLYFQMSPLHFPYSRLSVIISTFSDRPFNLSTILSLQHKILSTFVITVDNSAINAITIIFISVLILLSSTIVLYQSFELIPFI